jgi:hypothetical protein
MFERKEHNMETMGAPGVAELGLIVFVILVSLLGSVLTVVPFWKICSRAGLPGALSLLMLLPFVNIVFPFYVAFAQWPALKNQDQ